MLAVWQWYLESTNDATSIVAKGCARNNQRAYTCLKKRSHCHSSNKSNREKCIKRTKRILYVVLVSRLFLQEYCIFLGWFYIPLVGVPIECRGSAVLKPTPSISLTVVLVN